MIQVLKQYQNRYLIDPLTVGAIIGGGAVVGQLGGQYLAGQQTKSLAGSNRLQALGTLAQALNRPPEIPEIQYLQYARPEEYTLAGTLSPEALSETELRQIVTSPEFRQAQLDVLQRFQEQGEQGLTAIDRAALVDIQNEIARQERGQREAILSNMAQRGLAGSGQELAANLLAGQESAQRASEEGMRIAAQQQANRQEALARVAQLSGGLEQTDYERAFNAARAQDVINQFNVQNRNLAQAQNLAARQAIIDANIAERNRIAQANIDIANRERQQNIINRPLAQYGLQSDYTSALAGGLSGMAGSQAQQAMGQYQTQAGLLGTGLQTGGSLASAYVTRQPTQTTQTAQPNTLTASQVAQRQQEIRSQYPNLRVER